MCPSFEKLLIKLWVSLTAISHGPVISNLAIIKASNYKKTQVQLISIDVHSHVLLNYKFSYVKNNSKIELL